MEIKIGPNVVLSSDGAMGTGKDTTIVVKFLGEPGKIVFDDESKRESITRKMSANELKAAIEALEKTRWRP